MIPQIVCIQSDRKGKYREYAISGYPNIALIYDWYGNAEFPWFFTKVIDGVMQSGTVWRFETSYDALLDFSGWAHVPSKKSKK